MEDLRKLPQDSDGTGEEEEDEDISAAHHRVMELFKPEHPAAVEEVDTNPFSYEQFIQALNEKQELSPVPKASKPPRGEGEGQSISGDEETESAGAEVVVSQELSGEEGEEAGPPALTDEEKERKGEEAGEVEDVWPDLVGGAQVKPLQLVVSDETGEEGQLRVTGRGESSLLERKDASRDGSDASQVCVCTCDVVW